MKSIKRIKHALNANSFEVLLATLTLMVLAMPSQAAEDVHKDWILKVQTETLQRQFQYKGSMLKDIAKVTVESYHESDPNKISPYECVYYHDGKPIGMERTGELDIPLAQTVAIKVTHKSTASTEEEKATADIVRRLGLNVTHNHCSLIATILPSSSFGNIVQDLRKLGFQGSKAVGENANTAKALLALESEPSGMIQKLYYY